MKRFLEHKMVKGILFALLIIIIAIMFNPISIENMILSIENSQLYGGETPKEVTILNDDYYYQGYKITQNAQKFNQDNFLEYSIVNYPEIEFVDETVDAKLGEKINRLFYETAMLNYDEALEQAVNAFYSCDYFITFADENYICIYFMESISSGMGRANNFEDAITISLKTGDKVSLESFGDINTIMKKVDNYKGTIYTDSVFAVEDWERNKRAFIEQWEKNNSPHYYDYYLYDGRVGILFDHYVTGRVRIGLEFQGIINYQ